MICEFFRKTILYCESCAAVSNCATQKAMYACPVPSAYFPFLRTRCCISEHEHLCVWMCVCVLVCCWSPRSHRDANRRRAQGASLVCRSMVCSSSAPVLCRLHSNVKKSNKTKKPKRYASTEHNVTVKCIV